MVSGVFDDICRFVEFDTSVIFHMLLVYVCFASFLLQDMFYLSNYSLWRDKVCYHVTDYLHSI